MLRTKTPSGGDDGWWEGERLGRVGLFPSLVVEPVVDMRQGHPMLFRSQCTPPERLEIVEFDSINDTGLSKVFKQHMITILIIYNCSSPCHRCVSPV